MSWQILICISVLLFSLNGLYHRVLMKDNESDPFAQLFVFYGLGGLFSFIITLLRGGFHYQITLAQIPAFLLLTVFATAAPVLTFQAAKTLEASESSILLSSQRLWLVLGAFVFLGESFSLQKLLGTLIIISGVAIAQWKKNTFVINKAVCFLVIAALSYAITDLLSFQILRQFDAISFNVYFAILTLSAVLIIHPKTIKKLHFYLKPTYAFTIFFASITDTTATIFQFIAYQVGRNASQIAPILATNTIFTVILGILILKETTNMKNKLIGAITVVLGILLIL